MSANTGNNHFMAHRYHRRTTVAKWRARLPSERAAEDDERHGWVGGCGQQARALRSDRVGALVTEGASHRTGQVLFTSGSSGLRVVTPGAGRFTTSWFQPTLCDGEIRAPHFLQREQAQTGEMGRGERAFDGGVMTERPRGLASSVGAVPCRAPADSQTD